MVPPHPSAHFQPKLNINLAVKEEAGNHSCGVVARDNAVERGVRDMGVKPRGPKARPEYEGCS